MKPAPFEYSRAQSVEEACALLAADDGARLIAGGQTLVPLMAMRLARPTRLVDIARIPELAYVRDVHVDDPQLHGREEVRGEGKAAAVAIGAATKQAVVEHDALVRAKVPLLAKAMPLVGHNATRARGTIGGSLANGDSAAEIVLTAVTLGATLTWRVDGRTEQAEASQFFLGPMVTALPPAACLLEARFPVWSEPRVGTGFHEVNERHGDFAFAAAAAQIAVDGDGRCTRAALGIGAATAVPLRLDGVAKALEGTRCEESLVRRLVAEALAEVETMADLHASAEYRRRAAITLAVRAVSDAHRAARRA